MLAELLFCKTLFSLTRSTCSFAL